jgi:predicted signal transduction protein with EAL and GGDEF domain
MVRAIFRMLFWFFYSLGMIGVVAGCLIFEALTQQPAFHTIAIIAGVLVMLGIYKIMSTKIRY